MSPQSEPDNRHIRQVVLPSGRTIQVVYFGDAAGSQGEDGGAGTTELHICPECDSHLVYPVEWEEAGATHWRVALRCPNCEWGTVGVFEQELVELFDCELDRGTEALMRDLQRLSRANMESDIERFIDALQGDHLLPDDF